MFADAIRSSLADSTRSTYGTGQRALIQYSTDTGVTPDGMANASPSDVSVMFHTFASYLRDTRLVKSNTIDQYISHCKTTLTECRWHGAPYIRSPDLTKALYGWHRDDIKANPLRLSSSIPATCAVMDVFFKVATAYYHDNPRKCAEIKACAAATYYLALRAAEGASASASARELSDDAHHIAADKAFFRFPNSTVFYPAVAGTTFPPGETPMFFDFLQDTSKTSLARGSAHRSAHRNPRRDGQPFDVVLLIWQYVTTYPPQQHGAFFPTIVSADLTHIMKLTANHPDVQLDAKRLTARCMRSGSATMLRNMKNNLIHQRDLEHIRDHGNWAGDVGADIYAHANPDAERRLIAPSLYDCGYMTINYLRWFYMTPV